MILTPEERTRIDERRRDPKAFERREREAEEERAVDRRMWAGVMLTTDADVCASIMRGLPVLARQLDAEALRRALRGLPFPPPDEYVRVDVDMLDAVAEGGSFDLKARKR